MKNVLFRVDSSFQLGIGHLMRCLVLAKKYKKSNVIFASQELKGNFNVKITENKYKLEILQNNSKDELLKLLKKLKIDILIIDSYELGYEIEKEIKNKTNLKIVSLDDTYKKHYCDVLLNHNIYANKKKYKKLVPKNCKIMCGSEYTLLRDEFEKVKNNVKKIRNNIFISMGGADTKNLNLPILKIIENFYKVKVDIVTTTSNKNLDKLKKYCKNKSHIKLHINTNNIAKLMARSNFGIITPSVSANEMYYLEVPFICIKTEKNQEYMYKYLKKKNFLTLNKFNKQKLHKYVESLYYEK